MTLKVISVDGWMCEANNLEFISGAKWSQSGLDALLQNKSLSLSCVQGLYYLFRHPVIKTPLFQSPGRELSAT